MPYLLYSWLSGYYHRSEILELTCDLFAPLQDLSLPKTMVQRLAKGVLPANTQIQKDAILAMQKGATVFVNYLAQAYVRTNNCPAKPQEGGDQQALGRC